MYAFCDFKPMERFEMRTDMIVFRCSSDSTSRRVENKLYSVGLQLRFRKVNCSSQIWND